MPHGVWVEKIVPEEGRGRGRGDPRLLDSKLAPPAPVTWIMPRAVPSVTATITFRLSDGSTINWARNGQNLASGQENSTDLFVDLIDADWQRSGSGG